MNAWVAYCSRTGNTKKIAGAVAQAAGCGICTVGEWNPETSADILFLGGSIYGGKLDPLMEQFLKGLNRNKIRRVALFGTGFSAASIGLMKGILLNRGFFVEEESFSCPGKFLFLKMGRPNAKDLADAGAFAKRLLR